MAYHSNPNVGISVPTSQDAHALARALGGKVVGRNRILAPGPGHTPQDQSLSITVDPSAPDGFLVNSFASDDWRICRDYVLQRLGIERSRERRQGPVAHDGIRRRVAQLALSSELDEATEARIRRALAIWDEGQDPRGTLVERYLNEERELELTSDIAGRVLRFVPNCPWTGDDGRPIRVPAMVAVLRCIHSDRITGIHRRRLTPDGRKVGKPKMLGIARGAAIKIDACEDVTDGLAIGEGVETCLSARQLGLRPVWALGSADAIARFPILAGIEALTLLTEDDKTGANAKAVQVCGTRWHEARREVITSWSVVGGDMNDAIRGGRAND